MVRHDGKGRPGAGYFFVLAWRFDAFSHDVGNKHGDLIVAQVGEPGHPAFAVLNGFGDFFPRQALACDNQRWNCWRRSRHILPVADRALTDVEAFGTVLLGFGRIGFS